MKTLTRAIQCLYPIELQEDQPEDKPIAPSSEQAETSTSTPPVALNEPAIPEPWTDIKEESPEGDSGGECVGNLYQRRAGARRAKLTRRAQANLRVER